MRTVINGLGRRIAGASAGFLAVTLAFAGCSSAGSSGVAQSVPFRACAPPGATSAATAAAASPSAGSPSAATAASASPSAASAMCAGTVDGARYEFLLPDQWNGTLLVYSHGYRNSRPWSDQDTVETDAEPAPGWSSGEKRVANALLEQGYALAGSSFDRNGWAVADGLEAADDVVATFRAEVGQPSRIIAWGDSQGGLITALLAEQGRDWLDGAVSLCGPLAGVNDNFDLGLDASYGVKMLLDPQLQLADFSSFAQARSTFEQALPVVLNAGAIASGRSGDGADATDSKAQAENQAKLAYLAAIADAPAQTRTFDGSDPNSRASADAESVITALTFSTLGRQDIEQQFGGNISGNAGTDYAARISPDEAARIDAIVPGSVKRFNRLMASGKRISPDAGARAKAGVRGGTPTGRTTVPMLTVHTAADSLVVVQNQSVYAGRHSRVAGAAPLLQAFIVAPKDYPPNPGAQYGAGHCNFTLDTRVGAVEAMNDWLASGSEPSLEQVGETFGGRSGFDAGFQPGPWPAEAPQR